MIERIGQRSLIMFQNGCRESFNQICNSPGYLWYSSCFLTKFGPIALSVSLVAKGVYDREFGRQLIKYGILFPARLCLHLSKMPKEELTAALKNPWVIGFAKAFARLVLRISALWVCLFPVVSAIHGFAVGFYEGFYVELKKEKIPLNSDLSH